MNYLETEEVPMKHEGQEEERERAIVIVVTCHHIGTRTSWDVDGYAPSHLFCELGTLGFMTHHHHFVHLPQWQLVRWGINPRHRVILGIGFLHPKPI